MGNLQQRNSTRRKAPSRYDMSLLWFDKFNLSLWFFHFLSLLFVNVLYFKIYESKRITLKLLLSDKLKSNFEILALVTSSCTCCCWSKLKWFLIRVFQLVWIWIWKTFHSIVVLSEELLFNKVTIIYWKDWVNSC